MWRVSLVFASLVFIVIQLLTVNKLVRMPASYSRGPRFRCWSGDQLSEWGFSDFSLFSRQIPGVCVRACMCAHTYAHVLTLLLCGREKQYSFILCACIRSILPMKSHKLLAGGVQRLQGFLSLTLPDMKKIYISVSRWHKTCRVDSSNSVCEILCS